MGKEKVKVSYYIKNEKEKKFLVNNLLLGANIELTGTFSLPTSNVIPNTFNYKKYLYNKKIYMIFNAKSYVLDNKINYLYKIKNLILKKINGNKEVASYFKVFILGDKRMLSEEEINGYQKNGVSHLFSVSGMHIGLFSTILFFILKKLSISEKRSFLVVIIFLLFYAFLTSFPASIVRALIFFLFVNLNKLFNLQINNIQCLILTVFVIVFFTYRNSNCNLSHFHSGIICF